MSANDVLALKANFDTWKAERALELDVDPFVYYCIEQFLKPFPLSDEDILNGHTDGGNDSGVDAIFFLINRKPVEEDTDVDPKAAALIDLLIFQVQQSGGFSHTKIDQIANFTDDLLDLSKPESAYKTSYNSRLLQAIRIFKDKYQVIAGSFPQLRIEYFYVSNTDTDTTHPEASRAIGRVKEKVNKHLSHAQCEFHLVNAVALWGQVQKRSSRSKTLHWQTQPLGVPEGWVGLVSLRDYYAFLRDEHGGLQERIFESNVRGFQQDTPVNSEIRSTLERPGPADFWLLNNGITILSEKAQPSGYNNIVIDDPQIVNGLQTSRQIYEHFQGRESLAQTGESDPRRILVRVVNATDSNARDDIIRATNSQNKMPPEALRATDRIHGQIDVLFRQFGLYYDRRKGQYKDEGKPVARIVGVVYVLQAFLSIVLQRPHDARGRPRDYIKDDARYAQVFKDSTDIGLYLRCTQILRTVDTYLAQESLGLESDTRRNLKFYVAMLTAVLAAGTRERPSTADILKIDGSKVPMDAIAQSYKTVKKIYERNGAEDASAKGPKMLSSLLRHIKGKQKRQPAPA